MQDATAQMALLQFMQAGRPQVGDRIALLALASGIELGVVLITLDERLAATFHPVASTTTTSPDGRNDDGDDD